VHVQPHPGREPQRLRGEVQALLPRAGEVLPGKRAWHRASERAVHRYAFQRGVAGAVPSSTAHAIAGNVFTGTGRVKSAITSITSSIWARTSRSMAFASFLAGARECGSDTTRCQNCRRNAPIYR